MIPVLQLQAEFKNEKQVVGVCKKELLTCILDWSNCVLDVIVPM